MRNPFGLMLLAVTLPAAACFAAWPLIVDDTDPIDPGAYQFDFGVEHAAAERGNFGFPTNLTYGIGYNTQVLVGSGVTVQDNGVDERVRGLNDVGIATKTKFYDQARRRKQEDAPRNLKMALGTSLKLATANTNNGLAAAAPILAAFSC